MTPLLRDRAVEAGADLPGDSSPEMNQERSLPTLFGELTGQVITLAKQEVQLAKAEVKATAADSVGVIAGVMTVHMGLLFLFAAAAAGLALVVPVWAALLIVSLTLMVVGALVTQAAKEKMKRDAPTEHPSPTFKQTIGTIKETLA